MKNKIKILFLIPNLMHGGAEKVLVNLVNNMNIEEYDITVMTIMNSGVHIKELHGNIKYKYIFPFKIKGSTRILKFFSPRFIFKFFVKDNYDIVVSYLEGASARILSGCNNESTKKIAWIHIQMDSDEALKSGFRNLREAQCAYQKFDKIVCVSQDVKNTFCARMYGKLEESKVCVLYNTNETKDIIQKAKEKIDDVVLDKDIINICSVAKITETKGYDHLAHVHKRLINEGYKHHIYILGIGEMREEIENYLRKNNLMNSFTFLGYKENPYKYVAASDLYVCSSHREGFSTAVTEALIVGTPVVSTDCSGAKELLGENNEYGIVVENSEEGIYLGLKSLLSDLQLLEHYKEKAQQRGKKFGTTETVNAVQEMFGELMRN